MVLSRCFIQCISPHLIKLFKSMLYRSYFPHFVNCALSSTSMGVCHEWKN